MNNNETVNQIQQNLDNILSQKNELIIPQNIKEDVTILGVTGTLHEGISTEDADAVAGDFAYGKTAYVKGSKITGTLERKLKDEEQSIQTKQTNDTHTTFVIDNNDNTNKIINGATILKRSKF